MPWIAPVIGAVGSYLASRQAAKSGKPSAAEKQIQTHLLSQQMQGGQRGLGFLGDAKRNLQTGEDFNRKILNGNWSQTQGAFAPELLGQARANAGALNSSSRLGARSGMSGNARLQAMGDNQFGLASRLLGMKAGAADNLTQMGQTYGSLGGQLLSGSSATGLGMLGNYGQQRQQQFDMSRQSMASMAQLLGSIDWGGMYNRGTAQPQTLPTQRQSTLTMNQSQNPYATQGINSFGTTGFGNLKP